MGLSSGINTDCDHDQNRFVGYSTSDNLTLGSSSGGTSSTIVCSNPSTITTTSPSIRKLDKKIKELDK